MEKEAPKPVRLEDFEKAVYGRKKESRVEENSAAVLCLRNLLLQLREGAGFHGHPKLTPALITRACSAMVSLFTDPGLTLTQGGFDVMVSEKAVIETLFRSSAFGEADYIFSLMEDDDSQAMKYLPFFSLNSPLEFDFEAVFREKPQEMVGLYLALIGYGQVVTESGHRRREKLLGMAEIFKDVDLSPPLWNALCSAYMHCSYAVGSNKHDCKRVFHAMMEKALRHAVPAVPASVIRKQNPTMVVVLEWWRSQHAMYRSYASSIRQLREDFHLIGICPGKNTDEPAKAVFDEWIELDGENMNLSEVAPMVVGKQPDIVYYPSIGMGPWVIALASLRLAPIQVMTYGHPATSNSPVIDYGLIEADCYTEGRFSERVLTLPPGTVCPTKHAEVKVSHTASAKDRVKVAIPAMQVKLTYPFIRALKEVQKRSKKQIEFWFFSAARGIGLHTLAKDIAAQIEGVWVQEMQGYDEYMESIAGCDLVLFSFPFGGANSAYDALSLGIPMVSLLGEEPHSMSDASIARRAGLPEELIAKSVDEYVNTIVRLLDDDAHRIGIADFMRTIDMEKFYKPDESGAFLNAFRRIYRENVIEQAA